MQADLPPDTADEGEQDLERVVLVPDERRDLVDARLWREYEHLTGLYRFYLDLIVKVVVAIVFVVTTMTTLVATLTPDPKWPGPCSHCRFLGPACAGRHRPQ